MTLISLDDVADHLEQVHRYSGYIMFLCPEHDDHSPSGLAWDTGWKCLSCGAHGSLNSLYQKVSGRVVLNKYHYNPSAMIWKEWTKKFGSIKEIAKKANQTLVFNPLLANYLEQRKIEPLIGELKLGYLDGYYTFPIKDEHGEIKGVVARASPTIETATIRYSVSSDCPVKIYVPSWKQVNDAEEIYVTFGIIDSVSLFMAGYPVMTGLSGQGLNQDNLTMRKKHWIIPDRGEEQNALMLQYEMSWRAKALFLDYPDDCKDCNDIHKKYGIDKLKEIIGNAK